MRHRYRIASFTQVLFSDCKIGVILPDPLLFVNIDGMVGYMTEMTDVQFLLRIQQDQRDIEEEARALLLRPASQQFDGFAKWVTGIEPPNTEAQEILFRWHYEIHLSSLILNLRPRDWHPRDERTFLATIAHIMKQYPPPYTQLDLESCTVVFHMETGAFEVRMGSRIKWSAQ